MKPKQLDQVSPLPCYMLPLAASISPAYMAGNKGIDTTHR